jgi:hypothetical protein
LAAKRGQAVARPTASGEWKIRHGSATAAKAWSELSNTKMRNALARLYDLLVKDPRSQNDPDRHHQLKGGLATRMREGRELEQWQHEITGSGRVWFLIDDEERTVCLTHVGAGHPSKTD